MSSRINQQFLGEAAKWYLSCFSSCSERKIGLEKEYPVVDANSYQAGDARKLFKLLQNMGWEPVFDDFYSDEVIGVKKDGVEITTDAGWCTLEIIMPPEKSIGAAVQRIREIEQLVVNLCKSQGILVLGYGIQPITMPASDLWIKKRRHKIIKRGLSVGVDIVTITAAEQVHIDINRAEIVDATNVFNALSGPIILLFSNSPFWGGRLDDKSRLAVREDAWAFAGEQKAGIPPRCFADIEELVKYISSLEFSIARKGRDYLVPKTSFIEWAGRDNWREQWKFHEASVWWDARPRTIYGTIEVRQACSSKDSGCLPALVKGLIENLNQARQLIKELSWEEWHRLKSCAIFGLDDDVLQRATQAMLEISHAGLKKSNEENWLDPLWERLKNNTNPAKDAIRLLQSGGLKALIEHNLLL